MLSALLDRVVHLVLVPAHVLDVHLFARVLGAETSDPQDVLACGTQRAGCHRSQTMPHATWHTGTAGYGWNIGTAWYAGTVRHRLKLTLPRAGVST